MTVQEQLSDVILSSLQDKTMTVPQWRDTVQHVLGHLVPTMRMTHTQATMVLSFWEDVQEMGNSDKKAEDDSPLLFCDFSEIERRVMSWDGWHEGPVQNEFAPTVSPTGRLSSFFPPFKELPPWPGTKTGRWGGGPMQHLVPRLETDIGSAIVPTKNEDKT